MMQGWILAARVNTAPAIFCDSPYHLSVSTLTSRLINLAPASLIIIITTNIKVLVPIAHFLLNLYNSVVALIRNDFFRIRIQL